MNSTAIVGYAYDAAIHCPSCAQEDHAVSYFRVGKSDPSIDANRLPCELYDREGNRVTPVFCGEDAADQYCDDCLCQIMEWAETRPLPRLTGVDRPALNEAGHKEKPMDEDEYDGTRVFTGIVNGAGCSIMLMILIGLILYNLFN